MAWLLMGLVGLLLGLVVALLMQRHQRHLIEAQILTAIRQDDERACLVIPAAARSAASRAGADAAGRHP